MQIAIRRAAYVNLVLAVPETDCSWRGTEDIGVPVHPRAGEVCHVGMLGAGIAQGREFPVSGPQMPL